MDKKHTILETARRVLKAEAEALKTLASSLGKDFETAIEVMMNCQGRIIISGMGKSGHIARKIAATMASTGTPAYFVHPGEASHGDLGMITGEDVVLAMSNSGETHELADLIGYTRRHKIPLIAITAGAESSLASNADVVLMLPPVPEACPLGLAPTTSTTMTMALGDALAIAILEKKGFTAERFKGFHPGGKLGAVLVTVADLMHAGEDLPLVLPEASMGEALIAISQKGFGCVGVVDNGRLAGIVTDGDLRRHMGPDLIEKRVAKVMTRDPRTIKASELAATALREMNGNKEEGKPPITSLFVVDNKHAPIGLLHIHDLLRAGVM